MRGSRLFRRAQRLFDNAHELQFHLEAETEDNLARGLSPEEAYAAARRKLGNPTLIREEVYQMHATSVLETMGQDLRYAVRVFRRSPTFTLTAILTLALGIGGNTAMFTVIYSVLLKPLAYRDPNQLVRVSLEATRGPERDGSFALSRLEHLKGSVKSFSGVGAYLKFKEDMSLSGPGGPEAVKGARVSANFLDILGVQPVAGRRFLPEEDAPGGSTVMLISHELLLRRYHGDPQTLGKSVTLNSIPYTIVGVLPDGFAFPFVGTEVWVTRPAEWSVLPPRFWPFVTTLQGFARLNPQVSLRQAQAELDTLNQQYLRAHPGESKAGLTLRLTSFRDQLVSKLRLTLWMLLGAVFFVLLIACASVASLLLARASARSREFAVRAAVGAARSRLVRQLLVESLALSLAGGVAGLLLARWALVAIQGVNALHLPGVGAIHLNGSVLAFTLVLSVVTGILFGLFPALQTSGRHLVDELRESGAGAGKRAPARSLVRGFSLRGLLVTAQIALSIVLLIGAALLMKSLVRVRGVDPGFQAENVLTMKIALPPKRYDSDPKKAAFFRELARRAESVPGVRHAAVVMSLPTTADWLGTNVLVEGQPKVDGSQQPSLRFQSITPSYFRTLQIPLRRGRDFTVRDDAPGAASVAIINESFARRFWPSYPKGLNPIGQHLQEGIDKTGWMEIVGIVADMHESDLTVNSGAEFYVPLAVHAPQTAYLLAQTRGNSAAFVSALRQQVLRIDIDQPVSEIRTMDEVLAATWGQRRLTTLLFGLFAVMAMLLAVMGLYGVMAYSVSQRTQEVGIRRAVGAQGGDIFQLILSQGLALAFAGVILGSVGALALTRLLQNLLFEVHATDPLTFVVMDGFFLLIALAASFLPAWRASQIDPMAALRVG